MPRVKLADIAFDAGTQIRAAINDDVVNDYAELMTTGAAFPPVLLVYDGNYYYLADGFHRVVAARRNDFRDIDAEIRAGTKADAIWLALGANKANGLRLTVGDKKHAILLALQTWPERSMHQISEQSGISYAYVNKVKSEVVTSDHLSSRVTGKDGKSYPARRSTPAVVEPRHHEKHDQIKARLEAGESVETIRKALGTSRDAVSQTRKALGLGGVDRSVAAVSDRKVRMRELAAEGHTSRQIATAVGLSDQSCRDTLRKEGIDVPADRAVGKSTHHRANRIIEHIVMDAENLTADVKLIDFGTLDRGQLGGWIRSLTVSGKALEAFIRQLVKEYKKHEAA